MGWDGWVVFPMVVILMYVGSIRPAVPFAGAQAQARSRARMTGNRVDIGAVYAPSGLRTQFARMTTKNVPLSGSRRGPPDFQSGSPKL